MPRLLVTSRSDASGGGAGRVATELAQAARDAGWDVRHLVRVSDGSAPVETLLSVRGDVLLRNALGVDASTLPALAAAARWRPDLVHIHDPVVAFGTVATRRLAARAPTLVTLHDASGLAGGCLNPRDCERWRTGCGACPQLGAWPLTLPFDRTRATWRANARAARAAAAAVAPSHWLASVAREAAWRGRTVHVIPNPIDTDAFRPASPEPPPEAPPEAPLHLLFVASEIHDVRKGLHTLLGALRELPSLDVRVRVVGRGAPVGDDARVTFTGPIAGKHELAHAYRQADLLVTPSTEDNLPCIIAEAAACGTPTLGFATGGIPEMIRHRATGLLVADRTEAGLLTALRDLPDRGALASMGARAATHAQDVWSRAVVGRAYLALYHNLLHPAPAAHSPHEPPDAPASEPPCD